MVGWFLFFPFGFLFFLLFIGLILRVLFWGGRGGHYGPRHWGDGSGSRLDEWHRRAHTQGPADPSHPARHLGRRSDRAPLTARKAGEPGIASAP